tara:strand:- start:1964 stop:2188 length:225 start_codon:yes stop_codon:yes gene_type:complete
MNKIKPIKRKRGRPSKSDLIQRQIDLESIETRIHMYRDESRTISIRISALTERRAEINQRIKDLKELARINKAK